MTAPFRLDGRRALVTGAPGGIGRAIACLLHAQGASVVLTGTRADALESLAATLPGSLAIPADLTRSGEPERVARAAGHVDILVNNAGISKREPLAGTSDRHWREVMAINLDACFALARAFVPAMAERGWGRAIGIGSILGSTGLSGMAAYSASKAGLVAMHKAIALEFADRGVTANVVAPGYIRTAMMDMNPPETQRAILARIPVGFFGAPADVAASVLYLASDEARFVTGATLHVNGGMAMD